MILSIAWKNIWRNKPRSLVVILSVTIGIFSAVMLVAVMGGWVNQRVHDTLHNEIGHVRIHHQDFLLNEELHYTVPNYTDKAKLLAETEGVTAFAPRTRMFAFAQSDRASTGFIIKGIVPEEELLVSAIHKNLVAGEFFASDQTLPAIVIGSKAAENLKLINYVVDSAQLEQVQTRYSETLYLKLLGLAHSRYIREVEFRSALGEVLDEAETTKYADALVRHFSVYRLRSRIVVTLQNRQGELTYLTFRVMGVFKTHNAVFDAMNAFVEADKLQAQTGLGSHDFHEIALMCTDNETATQVASHLSKELENCEVLSWKTLSPELGFYNDYMKIMDYIYVTIFLLALSFGIVNTMLMAVLERVKELGMLMAIGMNRVKVFLMIMLESILLTFSGAVLGMVASGMLVSVLAETGINLSMWADGLEAMGFAPIIYPYLPFDIYIGVSILVLVTGILSSLWPARKALKLNPADALRME